MPVAEPRTITASSASARIIAAGIVIAFCYFASTVLVTLLVAVLMAYFLDPVVTWLERLRIPRALGSLLVVLVTLALLAVVAWSLVERLDQFSRDWPKFQATLRSATGEIDKRLKEFEAHVSEIEPAKPAGQQIVTVDDSHPVRTALLGRLNSLYAFVLASTFVPFLVFFMLAAKRQVWHATMQLFPATERTQVKQTLADVTQVLRSYVIGTVLVGRTDSGHRGLAVFHGAWTRLSVPDGAGFRPDQPDPLHGGSDVLDSTTGGRAQQVPYRYPLPRHLRDAHLLPHHRGQPADPGADRLASAVKRAGANGVPAVLGMALGCDGFLPRDSDHRRH
jgi:hypothetical protein